MIDTCDAVVLGAGITGASTARHLVEAGMSPVLLLERGVPAAGTGENAAIVRRHHATAPMAGLGPRPVVRRRLWW